MNLVQINEHLKDVPIQKLMEYANGKDPMVPAYMATGEMQRRESMQQRVAASQQAAQGQQPTVKDQIQQKAGLMALQAQQQQQAQQQMMQQAQAQPMPVPPQTPQPTMQEEEQPEYAMGGIAQLPVDYDFASGGIIAFAGENGSEVPVVEETEEEKMRRLQRLLTQGLPSTQGTQPPAEATPQKAGLPTLSAEPPKDTRPGANIPGLYDDAAQKVVQERLKPRSVQDIAATQAEADKLAGVTGKFGEEQMKRYGEEDAQYKEMVKDRAFNNLLSVLSGMGRGGLGGAAPAYLQAQAAQQAADIAQKRRMTEKYGDVEAKHREEAKAKSKDIMTPYEAGRTQAGDIASRQATQQMASLTEFEKEAINNKNALDRLDLQYKRDLEAAKTRFANDQELRKIENNYALERDKINNKARSDLEAYRLKAPTDEQRNFDSYLLRWQENPENKGKQKTEAFSQYSIERAGGGRSTDIGLHNLQVNFIEQIKLLENNITMNPKEKAEKIKDLTDRLNDVNLRLQDKVGLKSLPTGSTQLPPGFVPDQPGR